MKCISKLRNMESRPLTPPSLRNILSFLQSPSVVKVTKLPMLDPSTPWYEWLSYVECCNSLKVAPSLMRFIGYNRYYSSITSKKHEERNPFKIR